MTIFSEPNTNAKAVVHSSIVQVTILRTIPIATESFSTPFFTNCNQCCKLTLQRNGGVGGMDTQLSGRVLDCKPEGLWFKSHPILLHLFSSTAINVENWLCKEMEGWVGWTHSSMVDSLTVNLKDFGSNPTQSTFFHQLQSMLHIHFAKKWTLGPLALLHATTYFCLVRGHFTPLSSL